MHTVRIVEEHELPEGQGWAMYFPPDGGAVYFVKRSALTEEGLADAWRAFVEHLPPRHPQLRAV